MTYSTASRTGYDLMNDLMLVGAASGLEVMHWSRR